jgi:hypothetical protein
MWLLCAVMLPAAVQAQFIFITNNSAITITGYTGPGGDVVIPDTTNGYPVCSIGDGAFYNCSGLTNITIPGSVTNIGKGVFAYCANLASVIIPDSVSSIGIYAFYQCTGLTSVILAGNISSIGISTFDSCASLTNVTVPYSVTYIGSSSFQNCASLGSVTISVSVTNIGLYAFDSCTSLTAITVDPFNTNYSSMDGVLFDNTNHSNNTNHSTLIQCPAGKTGNCVITYGVTNIGNFAFHSCVGLTCITLPFSLKSIGDWAFDSCFGLKTLKIPNSITNIGAWAFDSCSALTSVSIPTIPPIENGFRGPPTIKDHAFEACTGLTSVMVSGVATQIMSFAFDGCTNVMGFYFQGDTPSVYNSTVFGSDSNSTVYYHSGRLGWGPTFSGLPTAQWVFSNGFTFTTNSGAITITGYNYGVQSTISLVIPNATNGLPVTAIGDQAFYDLDNVTDVTIPRSVTTIGTSAFYSCTQLNSIYCLGNSPIPTDDTSAFLYNNNPKVYYLPGTTGWGANFDGVPTASWKLPYPTILNFEPDFGIQTNSFGFTISWATNVPVVVEACTNLSNPVWTPVGTNVLTSGSSYFSDLQWANYPGRFYRLRWQ